MFRVCFWIIGSLGSSVNGENPGEAVWGKHKQNPKPQAVASRETWGQVLAA